MLNNVSTLFRGYIYIIYYAYRLRRYNKRELAIQFRWMLGLKKPSSKPTLTGFRVAQRNKSIQIWIWKLRQFNVEIVCGQRRWIRNNSHADISWSPLLPSELSLFPAHVAQHHWLHRDTCKILWSNSCNILNQNQQQPFSTAAADGERSCNLFLKNLLFFFKKKQTKQQFML